MCDPISAIVSLAGAGLMAHQVSQSKRSSPRAPQPGPRPSPPPLQAPELDVKPPILGAARSHKKKRRRYGLRIADAQPESDVGLNIPSEL